MGARVLVQQSIIGWVFVVSPRNGRERRGWRPTAGWAQAAAERRARKAGRRRDQTASS
jgi:hypothetical protein